MNKDIKHKKQKPRRALALVLLLFIHLTISGQDLFSKLIIIQNSDTIHSYDSAQVNAIFESEFSLQFSSFDTLNYSKVLPLCDSVKMIQIIYKKDTLYFFDRSIYLADKNNPLNKIYDFDYCNRRLSMQNITLFIDSIPFEKATLDILAEENLDLSSNAKKVSMMKFIDTQFIFEE